MSEIWIGVLINACLTSGYLLVRLGNLLINFAKKLKDPNYKAMKLQNKTNKQSEKLLKKQIKLNQHLNLLNQNQKQNELKPINIENI